jgi:glycosyltransferase involved in cell wall biosynthesis
VSAAPAETSVAAPRQARRLPRLVYIANLYPNLIETMIFREVETLRSLGFEIHTVSLRRPEERLIPPEARAQADSTHYVLPMSWPKLVARVLSALLRHPIRLSSALASVWASAHDGLRERLRSLAHALQAAAALPEVARLAPDHIHAHWATGATTCALVLARVLDRPFSFTAHAYDIWRERLALPAKLRAARFVVTCTEHNAEHLAETYGVSRAKIHTVHHGTDVARFGFAERAERETPTVIAVGRLVEQKGLELLLAACARLAAEGVPHRCLVVGEGPLRGALEAQARELGIADRVEFRGQVLQQELAGLYAAADVFALFCRPAADEDRDGIPNVMIEAMATGLPVVSTRFSGIPELVVHEETGLLAEVDDADGQAAVLRCALEDAPLRARLGRAARRKVEQEFTLAASAGRLATLFGGGPAPSGFDR